MKWLRDNMGFIKDIQTDTESLAQEVFNTGDVYFVPAFKGLYAPYWRKDARGCVHLFFPICKYYCIISIFLRLLGSLIKWYSD